MKWLRLWTEWAHDPKIISMPEHMRCRHVVLLCLRRQVDTASLTDEEIASYMRISMDELQETKELFSEKRFIDNGWNVLAWDDRQPDSDSGAERQRKYRERQKKKESNVTVTSPLRHSNALDTDTDTDTDTEKDKKTLVRKKEILRTANEIFDLYPRKDHKKRGLEIIVARLNQKKPVIDPEQLKEAIKNFLKDAERKDTTPGYYPYAKTFFAKEGQWTEFLIEVAKCINCTKERPVIELNEAGVCAGSCRR